MNRVKVTWRRAVRLLNGGNLRRALLDFLQITVGAFLIALAFNLFFVPNDVVPGGVSGIAILLRRFLGTPVGLVTLALNVRRLSGLMARMPNIRCMYPASTPSGACIRSCVGTPCD